MLKNKMANPIFMWFIVVLGIFLCFIFIADQQLFKSNYANVAVFLIGFIFWIYFFISSIKVHRHFFASADKIEKLIITGIYGKMRHPIYVGDILLAWSVFILFPHLNVLGGVVWLSLVLIFWMKIEEKSLINKFGQAYLDYRKRTNLFKNV